MMHLIVKNGIIANIIVSDEAFAAEIGALPCYDGAEIGKTYSPPPDMDKLRAAALSRIDGKCSGAIYSGIDYENKHYSLTPTAQQNITNAVAKVQAGATSVPFAADGEELTAFPAATITTISAKANEWGTVNICYKGKLAEWIAAETDAEVLGTINYGMTLPDAYMQALGTQLAGFGINLNDWAAALSK